MDIVTAMGWLKWILVEIGPAAVVGLVVKVLGDRQLQRIKAKQEREMEQLRSELSERRDLLNSMQAVLTSIYSGSHDRVLGAMEKLWGDTLRIREFSAKFIGMPYSILTQEELRSPAAIDRMSEMLPDDYYHQVLVMSFVDMELSRPFISNRLWTLFFVYRAFALRLASKVVEGIRRGEIPEWDRDLQGRPDGFIDQVLMIAINEDELDAIRKMKIAIPQQVLSAIEFKMLDEMQRWILGSKVASHSVEERLRIKAMLECPSNEDDTVRNS